MYNERYGSLMLTVTAARELRGQRDAVLELSLRECLFEISILFCGTSETARAYEVTERARLLGSDVWFAVSFRSLGLRPKTMGEVRTFGREVASSKATSHVRGLGLRAAFIAGVLGRRWAPKPGIRSANIESTKARVA